MPAVSFTDKMKGMVWCFLTGESWLWDLDLDKVPLRPPFSAGETTGYSGI